MLGIVGITEIPMSLAKFKCKFDVNTNSASSRGYTPGGACLKLESSHACKGVGLKPSKASTCTGRN